MGAFKKLQNLSMYIGIFIGSILTQISYDFLKQYGFPNYLLVILLFVIFAFTIDVLSNVIRVIINRSSVVRQIILGRDYIEGQWIDTAVGEDSKSYSIYLIRFVDESYQITGKEFDKEGNILYDWQSVAAHFDGDRLIYLYSSHSRSGVEENYGVTSVTFMRPGPNRSSKIASGYFVDAATNFRKRTTSAEKLSDHNLKDLNSLSTTKELIRQWAMRSAN